MGTYTYPNPEAMFYQQYETVRRDEIVGILLALFLGTFGAHHFYLRRTGLGILYLCFFWSGIPAILGFIECFFMPGRVREFNAIQAAAIAGSLGIAVPGWGAPVNIAAPPVAAAAAGRANVPDALVLPLPGATTTCPKCQYKNVVGARFCAGCGNAL
jgi:TM2 domain-containing membrane protein YozV